MEPGHPIRFGGWAEYLPALLLGASLFGVLPPALASSQPDALYRAGTDCQTRLDRSPKLRTKRHQWEACIRPLEQLANRYPKDPLVKNALFRLGDLYGGLFRYSGNPADARRSLDYFETLSETHRDSDLGRRAQRRLDTLRTSVPPVTFATVENIRHWAYPDYTRIVLDLDREIRYETFSHGSDRISVTLTDTKLGPNARGIIPSLNEGLLKRLTVENGPSDTVRVEIDLKQLGNPPKTILLSNPDRLVLDLFSPRPANRSDAPPVREAAVPHNGVVSPILPPPVPFDIKTIVIDPGHGGKDPGAIGRGGLTEKEVVLDIGQRLKTLLEQRMGKTVIMTRDRDTFISLDDRTLIANSKRADLFVSIHVNSHPQKSTRGVEIYHLGQSTDSRAMAVAARENNVSLNSLGNLDKSVKQILFTLDREYNLGQSQELAHYTRGSFKSVFEGKFKFEMVDHGVKRAPFYVLLNSNMPSILAEVSFISNPGEENLLRRDKYRQAIAESLYEGIQNYLAAVLPVS